MKIGIDISQLAYENTGVSNYLLNFVKGLINEDDKNEYILFYSSLRKKLPVDFSSNKNVKVKIFKMPPTLLDLIWNKLHIMPIESLIGHVDVFITSDWTEPPTKKAKKATILYDLIVYKYPKETHERIIEVQKRKLGWVKKETSKIFCISKSTAEDAREILGIDSNKLSVIYPGF
jgi:hypothetical protein